jgi:hypothetical protein
MKTLAGMLCLLFFSFPAFSQGEVKTDSIELHVDGKIIVTVAKDQINNIALSIPLARGSHKISWVKQEPILMTVIKSEGNSPLTELALVGFIFRNKLFVKNYSEF